jgi:hypothetical protein
MNRSDWFCNEIKIIKIFNMDKKIKFVSKQQIFSELDATEYLFIYELISNNEYVTNNKIKVSVSGSLISNWKRRIQIDSALLERVLLDFAKYQIIQDVKNDNVLKYQDLNLDSRNTPSHSNHFTQFQDILNRIILIE